MSFPPLRLTQNRGFEDERKATRKRLQRAQDEVEGCRAQCSKHPAQQGFGCAKQPV